MAQFDPIAIKSGILTVLGTDTLRADRLAAAGLTITGPVSGDACQVSGALTLGKAVNTSTSPIVGIYDGESNSVVRKGVVVATMKAGVTLANGDTVWLSSTAGALTNVKPTMDMLHEVGVVVDAATRRVLLQQKPVIALPATPPPYLLVVSSIADYRIRKINTADGSLVWNGADAMPTDAPHDVLYDGTFIWTLTSAGQHIRKYSASTGALLGGPFNPYGDNSCQMIAFDGVNYWNTYNSWGDSRIVKWDVNGAYVNSWVLPVAMEVPWGVCYDGDDIIYCWSLNYRRVGKFRISTSTLEAYSGSPIDGAGSTASEGVCWDGANLWIGHDANLITVRGADLVVVNYVTLPHVTGGICYDGANVWVTCYDNRVYKYRCSDFAAVGDYPLAAFSYPSFVVFDGTNIWVTMYSNFKIRKLLAATGAFIGDYGPGNYYFGMACTSGSRPWPVP